MSIQANDFTSIKKSKELKFDETAPLADDYISLIYITLTAIGISCYLVLIKSAFFASIDKGYLFLYDIE
jgi:hypothetical protein